MKRGDLSRALTMLVTCGLERLRLARVGTSEAARFFNVAADVFVEEENSASSRPVS